MPVTKKRTSKRGLKRTKKVNGTSKPSGRSKGRDVNIVLDDFVDLTENGSTRIVRMILDGELPLKMDRQFIKHRGVHNTKETKDYRARIAGLVKKVWGKRKPPTALESVSWHVFSKRKRPDLDVAFYQIQNALTKDTFEIEDNDVGSQWPPRSLPQDKPAVWITARYVK